MSLAEKLGLPATLALVFASTACAPELDRSFSKLPTYAVDPFACEVTWQRTDGVGLPSDAASRERAFIAGYLNALMGDRTNKARPARFKIGILELPGHHYQVSLVFDVDGQFWTAEGSARSPVAGVYRALLKAIEKTEKNKSAKASKP